MNKEQVEAFVAKRSDYYFNSWFSNREEKSFFKGFNLAAFILAGIWLLYRKLYVHFGILFLVIAIDLLISSKLEEANVLSSKVITIWDYTSPFVYGIVIGIFANKWYFDKFRKISSVAEKKSDNLSEQIDYLKTKGGTNGWGVFFALLLFIFIVGVLSTQR